MILGIYFIIVSAVGWYSDYWIGENFKHVPWEPVFAIAWMAGALLVAGINYAFDRT